MALVGVFGGLSLACGSQVVNLADATRDVMIWPTWHNEYRYMTRTDSHFFRSDESLYLLWGVRGVDNTRCSMWNETDLGELVWDERFDAADPDAQLALLRACTEPLQRTASLHIKPGAAPLCPLSAFDEWLGGRNQSLPLTRAEFESLLPTFLELRPEWTPFISLDGTRLRHLVVQYTLVVQRHANAAQRRVLYERWEAEVAQLNAAAPQAVGAAVQSAGVYWMTMVVQVRAPNTPPPAPGLIYCLVQALYEYPNWRCQLALS